MIFQGDVIIAETIRLGLEDLRENIWLLDDIFSSFKNEPSLAEKYGQKEIDAAKDWFLNNRIEVNLRYRNDKDQFPCVTIALGSSSEKDEMRHLGDHSFEVEQLLPSQIGKPIPYILKPFVPEGYDDSTGELSVPQGLDISTVEVGQILVDPDNGNGYIIQGVGDQIILLEPNLNLSLSRAGVVPKYQFYRVRRNHSFFQESYSIGCHVHGDPAALLWLHSIVLYLLLRYRKTLLEAREFEQSSLSSTDMVANSNFEGPGGENVFSRFINITGQVRNTWLDAPKRVIESVKFSNEECVGGIKIISNENTREINGDELWTTIDGDEER